MKVTINPKNNDDKCFHYSLTAALNHERISKIKPFTDQYNWKETAFPSHKINQLLLICDLQCWKNRTCM